VTRRFHRTCKSLVKASIDDQLLMAQVYGFEKWGRSPRAGLR
jgi:hypothetical protein